MVRKRRKKFKKLTIIFSVLVLIIIIFAAYTGIFLIKHPFNQETYVRIPPNASTRQVVKIMNEYGALQPASISFLIMRGVILFTASHPHSGTYRFTKYNTNFDIMFSIFTGRQLSVVSVTFPEGITIADFARIAQLKLGVDSANFVKETQNRKYIKQLGIPINSLEGYLMPETYFFYYKAEPSEIVQKLIAQQDKIWKEHFEQEAEAKGFSRHLVLTLASIIEAETPSKEERSRISGVFYNRLKRGLKLESDPTVQYAIGSKRRLTLRDLNYDSPFNTYLYKGLPPGPINSPSISAIEAALNPERHNYLYFVSIGDGSGKHLFSETFAKHLTNKGKFKKNRRKNHHQ
jgi:UPF0755 protein